MSYFYNILSGGGTMTLYKIKRINMKLVAVVVSVGIGMVGLVGCGGSSSGGEIPLKTPTATISEQNTTALLDTLAFTLGVKSFTGSGGGSSTLENVPQIRTTASPEGDGWHFNEAGEKACEISGSKTLKYTKGSKSDGNNPTGDAAIEKIYTNCKDIHSERSGKVTKGLVWTFTDTTRDYTKTETATDYNRKYEGDSFRNTKQYEEKLTNYIDKVKKTEKGSKEYTFTGNGKIHGFTWSVENKKFNSSWDITKDIETNTRSVRLSINKEEYGGWITMETTTPFKEQTVGEKSECLAGEAKIAAANHSITVSCINKKYIVKFDGEEVTE